MIVYLLVYVNRNDRVIEVYRANAVNAFEDLEKAESHVAFDTLGKAGWQMCGVDNKDSDVKGITAYWFSKTSGYLA